LLEKILGSECETCGAGPEAILYLQHTVKNPRVQPYIEAAKERLNAMEPEKDWRPELKAQMYEIRDAEIAEARDCCPICESLSIQFRKGAVNWICNSKAGGRLCGHVFTKPTQKMALTAAQKKTIRKHKYQAYKNIILHREHDVIRQAMLDWIKDWRQYLSLKYTKTLCKRCAYIEDMLD
jgi:tRNA(Arg) A34 adenosine deaminase TadA